MSIVKKNINIIHNCEERFYDWLKIRLSNNGILHNDKPNLSYLLDQYEHELSTDRQHLKPLQKWNKIKDECYELSAELNGHGEENKHFVELVEKTAFEGQILWLTFQEE